MLTLPGEGKVYGEGWEGTGGAEAQVGCTSMSSSFIIVFLLLFLHCSVMMWLVASGPHRLYWQWRS